MTEAEFEASIKKYRKALVGYARSYVNDRDRAEDPVQEACVDLLPKYSAFSPKRSGAEKHWYRKFVRFCIFRLWRREAKHQYPLHARAKLVQKVADGDEEIPLSLEVVDPQTLQDPVFHNRYRLAKLVEAALQKFPPDVREAIWEHFVMEKDWEEIGQELGLNANAAESFFRPYVRRLRQDLQEWRDAQKPRSTQSRSKAIRKRRQANEALPVNS